MLNSCAPSTAPHFRPRLRQPTRRRVFALKNPKHCLHTSIEGRNRSSKTPNPAKNKHTRESTPRHAAANKTSPRLRTTGRAPGTGCWKEAPWSRSPPRRTGSRCDRSGPVVKQRTGEEGGGRRGGHRRITNRRHAAASPSGKEAGEEENNDNDNDNDNNDNNNSNNNNNDPSLEDAKNELRRSGQRTVALPPFRRAHVAEAVMYATNLHPVRRRTTQTTELTGPWPFCVYATRTHDAPKASCCFFGESCKKRLRLHSASAPSGARFG